MSTGEIIFAAALTTILVLVAMAPLLLALWEDFGPDVSNFFRKRSMNSAARRERRRNKGKPAYERLALAYEREAEKDMASGDLSSARYKLSEAQRIRTEATEAMMNGEEPPL